MTVGSSVTCLDDGDEEEGLAGGDDKILSMEKGLSLLLLLLLLLSIMLILSTTSCYSKELKQNQLK